MKTAIPAYRIFPIGDSAVTIDFGNAIDENINSIVIQLFNALKAEPLPGMKETVPAYSSISVYYDLFQLSKTVPSGNTVSGWISQQLEERLQKPVEITEKAPGLVTVPVCYESAFAPDIEHLSKQNNISVDEIIQIHSSKQYRVYMLGFLPGFSYMGETDERIAIPRKSHPQQVEAGSIGIAGRQTGIYPSISPGGWHIIGRTPVKLFDAACSSSENNSEEKPFCLLQPGDAVQFISISKNEFENY